MPILQDDWSGLKANVATGALGDFQDYLSVDLWDAEHAVMDLDPRLLSAKASKYN